MVEQSLVGAADLVISQIVTPAGERDPGPLYDQLLRLGPIHRSSDGLCYVAGHSACDAALRSPAFGVGGRFEGVRADWRDHPTFTILADGLLMADPPHHTRLRRLVTGAFTARRVQAMRQVISVLVDGLLDRLAEEGAGGRPVDFMSTVAFPLPVAVISAMLGLPVEDFDRIGPLVRTWVGGVRMSSMVSEEALRAADDAADEIRTLLADAVAASRRDPGDDLLSALIDARDHGTGLSEDELLTMLLSLYVAGFIATAHLLGNALVAFESFPDQADLLRDRPDLAACAVEELLRYDAPLQIALRLVLQDVTIEGEFIPGGTPALILIGAANRDPRVFDRPDRLDLRRNPNPHLTFSGGIHYCVGAALGKLEASVALPALLRRFPDLRVAPERRRMPGLGWRGHDALQLHLGQREVARADTERRSVGTPAAGPATGT